MKLPKGITGIYHVRDADISMLQRYQVKSLLGSISYPFEINIKQVQEPHPSSNYWRLKVISKQSVPAFDLLIHQSYWYCAAVSSESQWMNLSFQEIPDVLQAQLKTHQSDLICLSPSLLRLSLAEADLSDLSDAELEEIRYWKSKTIGEVIFNGYD